MDSRWFNQAAATNMNGYDLQDADNKIDLNLKLGLPDSSDRDNRRRRLFDENNWPPFMPTWTSMLLILVRHFFVPLFQIKLV